MLFVTASYKILKTSKSHNYFLLNSGTEEQASPNIIDFATGFKYCESSTSAFGGTGLCEQPLIITGMSLYIESSNFEMIPA